MASVEKRVRDGNVTWLARWRDPEGKQRKRSFPRKLDAERHIVSVQSSKLRGDYVDPAEARRTTVEDQVWRYVGSRPHSSGTRIRTASLVRAHVVGTRLGGMLLAAVRPSDVQSWASERATLLAPGTVKLVAGYVRAAFRSAVEDRLLVSSPVPVRLALPRAQAPRLVPLTVTQVHELALAVPDRMRAMVLVQAGLGLRVGELMALRPEDVNFLRQSVRIEWQLDSRTHERRRPKTARSIRTVPLPSVIGEVIAQHMVSYPPGHGDLLFTAASGKPYWREHYGTRVFARAVAAAGLPTGTTSHDLRHHYASVLLAAGESVVAVSERLGHEDASLVLTTYGHLMPDSEDRTRRAIDAAWCAPYVPRATGSSS